MPAQRLNNQKDGDRGDIKTVFVNTSTTTAWSEAIRDRNPGRRNFEFTEKQNKTADSVVIRDRNKFQFNDKIIPK